MDIDWNWLEAQVLEGLASGPAEPMTAEDWTLLHRSVAGKSLWESVVDDLAD